MARLSRSDNQLAKSMAFKKLGRLLNPGECVKVIDNSKPITPDNVMIFKCKGDMSKYNTNMNGKYIFEEDTDHTMKVSINPDSPFIRHCLLCGKEFVINDLFSNKKFCSRECSALSQRSDVRQKYIALPNIEGNNNNLSGKRITEIKAVAGINIGRQLRDTEYAYAKDGNQNNLDPDNIVVLSSYSDFAKMINGRGVDYRLVKNSDGITYHAEEYDHNKTVSNPYVVSVPVATMQSNLNRPLLPEEVVYQVNQSNPANDIGNLKLFDNNTSLNLYQHNHFSEIKETVNENGATHVSRLIPVVEIHKSGYDRICRNCGRMFNVIDKNNPRTFCSDECRIAYNRNNNTNILY